MTTFTVNGKQHSTAADADTPLLWVLREELGLTGVKFGCGVAACGACTVYFNGAPARSCSLPLAAAAGAQITTIEGLGGAEAAAVQNAWQKLQVPQCGWCQSGQVMSAVSLLQNNRAPTDADITAAMAGNVCRCAAYTRIRAAVRDAADTLEKTV